jgi:hypothetical protein
MAQAITYISQDNNDAIIDHVSRLTHENLNNEAYIAVADYFMQDDLVEIFESYKSEQCHLGYMTNEAIARRNVDKNTLLDTIELMQGEHARKVFNSLL